jgi:tyrosyl-tRNA synthetase
MPKLSPLERDERIRHLLSRAVERIEKKEHLASALRSGTKLRIKHGIDPTGPKIHIGRAVVLWKLREFQELGHTIQLVIGDFTAQIGDPSDKLSKRPFLTKAQIKANLKSYLPQIGKILDLTKVEVHYNSTWLQKLGFREILDLAELFTASQMLRRRNFAERFDKDQEITLREFMYPIMQGYDSVALKADVEIGGSDQLFNLLAGRKIQEAYGQKPQDILTTEMLIGTDGRKMSTSWGNVVNIVDSPNEQFGKLMAMHDDQIFEYFRLATNVSEEDMEKQKRALSGGMNPKDVKMELARIIVARYHGEKKAATAATHFDSLFAKKEIPDDIPELPVSSPLTVLDLVFQAGVSKSKSDARRLIEQGGFSIDGEQMRDPHSTFSPKKGSVIRLGKKSFFRIG